MKLHLIQLITLFFFLYFIINFINLPKSLCLKFESDYNLQPVTPDVPLADYAPVTSPPVPAVITSPPQNSTQNVTRSATADKNLTAAPTPTSSTVPDAESTYHAHGRGAKKFLLAILVGVGVIVTATMVVILCCLRRKVYSNKWALWKKKTRNTQSVKMFLKNEPLIPKRYKFSEIKKITNSFKEKLGQGAFGAVFKGKLDDGRVVAVKVLKESKGNGEEFINEITSISRTSHVHVVTILGFCFEDSKRALIYEFMPNGSLENFIYDRNPLQKYPHLEWETLYKIAIGIARGLEYLHRGCNTRILHFDIKPHNILLDQEFCPKLSDFGLAKLCLKKESIISMTGARGTPGYIAPELINRNFGGVSHKSDVYSYGMMVLEMVGGRKNIDTRVENVSEIYFPHWIYKRLDTCRDLGLHGVTTTEDEEIARKMILVGLWCIQMDPSHRPAMNRVLEMLEGSLDAVQTPPMPFFTSPSRSPPIS